MLQIYIEMTTDRNSLHQHHNLNLDLNISPSLNINNNMNSSNSKMSSPALIRLQAYPPRPAPSQEQIALGLRAIDPVCILPSDWDSERLPSSFFTKYGPHTIRHYADFRTIMAFPSPPKDLLFLSKETLTFPDFCRKISFVDFAKKSDKCAKLKDVLPLGRKEMEAAWMQELFWKFDGIELEGLKVRYARKKEEMLVRWCKELLAKAVRKPYAIYGVEKYWEQKKAQFPDLDMERLLDWKLEEGEKEMEMPELEGDDHEIGGVDDNEILGGGDAARADEDGQGDLDDDAMNGEMEDGSTFAPLAYKPRPCKSNMLILIEKEANRAINDFVDLN